MAHIWMAVVLRQTLYGSEARSLPAYALQAVRQHGLMIVPHAAPLRFSHYNAAEVVGSLPLGDSATGDISEEALSRRIQWLLVMANQPGLAGTVHRFLATMEGPVLEESTPALASAVATLHWTV